MANPSCATAVDNDANSSQFHTVFVDTSLNTHMAMVVEETDTIADFKMKIQREHVLCFPEVREIGIKALQVKRRGFLYHLSDSMTVRSAFDGIKSRWFLYADVCSMGKQGMQITEDVQKVNGVLCLEHNVLEDKANEQLNEFQKDNCFNGKVKTKPLGNKRKLDDTENPVYGNLLNGDFSGGDDKGTIIAQKKRKVQKKDTSFANRSSSKTMNSTVDVSHPVVCASLLDGNNALHSAPIANVTFESEIELTHEDPVKDQSRTNQQSTGITNLLLNSEMSLHPYPTNVNSSMENTDVDCKHPFSKPAAASVSTSFENQLPTEVPVPSESNCAEKLKDNSNTSIDKATADGIHIRRPAAASVSEVPDGNSNTSAKRKKKKAKSATIENQLPTAVSVPAVNSNAEKLKDTTNSSIEKAPLDGDLGLNVNTAILPEVPTGKSKPSTKQKKNKTKSKTPQHQLPTNVPAPVEVNDGGNVKDTTDVAGKVILKNLGARNMEEALHDSNQLAENRIDSVDKNQLLPKCPTESSLENQKLADQREKDHAAKAPELFHSDGFGVPLKSGEKTRKEKKEKGSHKKKKIKLAAEAENVETTVVEILSQPSTGNIQSKAETTNIQSHLVVGGKVDEVADSDELDKASNRGIAMGDVGISDRSEVHVLNAKEANQNDSQFKDNIDLKIAIPKVDKVKKSKRKRSSTNNPEIQLQEKVVNTSQSINDLNIKDRFVGDDNCQTEYVEKNNDKKVTSIGTYAETDQACQVEGKLLDSVDRTNPCADKAMKDNAVSAASATEEITLTDYFVPSQQKPGVANSSDAGNAIDERSAVKDTNENSNVKKKSTDVPDGKNSQVVSSQESLTMRQPHGDVLHSDTESFRVPKDRTPTSSAKQKLKSCNKKSKQINSAVASPHSPSASATRKSNSSHKETKLNKTQTKAVSQTPAKENAKTFTASKSGEQPTKSKQPVSKTTSAAAVMKAESAAIRKTLLSANIFKDDNDESSEDEDVVEPVHDPYVSEVEDDTGFATPTTVGQRKAAEVEGDSSPNKYTLEKLRLEKAKRDQESGIQIEEFMLDSQPDQIS